MVITRDYSAASREKGQDGEGKSASSTCLTGGEPCVTPGLRARGSKRFLHLLWLEASRDGRQGPLLALRAPATVSPDDGPSLRSFAQGYSSPRPSTQQSKTCSITFTFTLLLLSPPSSTSSSLVVVSSAQARRGSVQLALTPTRDSRSFPTLQRPIRRSIPSSPCFYDPPISLRHPASTRQPTTELARNGKAAANPQNPGAERRTRLRRL